MSSFVQTFADTVGLGHACLLCVCVCVCVCELQVGHTSILNVKLYP